VSVVDLSRARWRKSSRSGGGNNTDCVEVAFVGTVTAVRDSKNQSGAALVFPYLAWRAFLTTTESGAFDSAQRR
jgi:hypothetical protein